MGYPTFTVADLSAFSGRPQASYPPTFTNSSALPQATMLFKIGSCLTSVDHLDETQTELVRYAILSMADGIVLAQPFQSVLSNPFSSESIGSYSYSKVSGAIMAGLPTGIAWFDMAIQQLSVCDENGRGDFSSGGIEVFEYDGNFRPGRHPGNVDFLSPQDIDQSRIFGFDPAPIENRLPAAPGLHEPGDSSGPTWVEDPDNPGLYYQV